MDDDIQKAAASFLFPSVSNKQKKRNKKKKGSKGLSNPLQETENRQNPSIQQDVFDLVKMNQIVEDIVSPPDAPNNQLPAGIWDEWVFRSNPNEPPNAESLLNRCQLLGLLICRYRAARQPPYTQPITLNPSRLTIIHNKPPSKMTLRELRDSMANLVLQWGPDIHSKPTIPIEKDQSTKQILLYLDACFHRLGELVWATWPVGCADSPIADDVGSIERICLLNGVEHDQVTLSSMRSLINTFMMGYRLVHWIQLANIRVPDDTSDENLQDCTPIHQHHVAASIDVFYQISMYYDLPPAARLNYRHMFSGLYNCISQPVYYHNPDYQRRIQLDLKQIAEAKVDISTLPIMLQMYPEVTILYDDDDLLDALPQSRGALKASEKLYAWRWLLTSSRVYLFRWDPLKRESRVYREMDGNIIRCLRRNYIPHRNKHFVAAAQKLAASGSVSLLHKR